MKQISAFAQAFAALLLLLPAAVEPVPVPKTAKQESKNESIADGLLPHVSYKQYLSEVINILENDKEFSERVRKLNKTDDLAYQLEFASHSVRSRLDEIKRQEVDRLNALEKMLEAKEAAKGDPQKLARVQVEPEVQSLDAGTIARAHLDHENPHTFEISDLKKLIQQVTDDLRQVEVAKEAEYKRYEMGKEHERLARLRRIKDQKAREAAELRFKEARANRRRHGRVHEPGSREQLQDAWEQGDHMDKDSFDPRTFFMMHDINGDGHLDIGEIEALFLKELDKVYANENDTTVDKYERQHEMERMRRTMLTRVDTNGDMMLSWPEFERWTRSQEYKRDKDWQTAEEEESHPFKDDEFKQFEEDFERAHPIGAEDAPMQPGELPHPQL